MSPSEFTITVNKVKSSKLKREVEFLILKPAVLKGNEELNLLLLNDGQDAEGLHLRETLSYLFINGVIDPVIVVAIKASDDRMQEYGVAGIPDYLRRGAKADQYAAFVVEELLPLIEKKIVQPINGRRAIAGCSMGGLSAFDIAWNHFNAFDAVGVFSGSFWWRRKDLNDGYQPSDRIMQQVVRDTEGKPDLKFWIMTGTEDETEDRNHNFIIDSIDDAIDLIKELHSKGYKQGQDISYYEMVGGKHDVPTWAKVMPAFLTWAFPRRTHF
ncbi:MAG: esterase [Pedobacter sp.]|nr:esterase [Pedobacter sp.]